MANVMITGGAGFLGSRLARALLAAGSIEVAADGARPLSRVTLLDRAPVPADLAADERVAASFLSGIIREPLAGQHAICPVGARTEVALASPAKAIDGLLCAARSSDAAWGGRSAVNLPALTVTVADMVAALERAAGPEVSALIDWVPDPAVAGIVTNWPARFRGDRAARLGLAPDPDFYSVIMMHLAEAR